VTMWEVCSRGRSNGLAVALRARPRTAAGSAQRASAPPSDTIALLHAGAGPPGGAAQLDAGGGRHPRGRRAAPLVVRPASG